MIVMRTNFFLRLFLVFNFIIGVSLAGCNVENNEKNSGMEKNVCLESGKSSVSCPLKPSDSAPLKHSTMPP